VPGDDTEGLLAFARRKDAEAGDGALAAFVVGVKDLHAHGAVGGDGQDGAAGRGVTGGWGQASRPRRR